MHYVLLGKSADLAFAEVVAIAKRFNLAPPTRLSPSVCSIDNIADVQVFCQAAGGIVKIFTAIGVANAEVAGIVADLVSEQQDHFALSSFQRSADLRTIANRVREGLKEAGIKPHFRILTDPYESAGITTKSTEYCVNDMPNIPMVLKTVAVQDLYYWTAKDYGRPAIDPHSGMMPPKIARTMVNLALQQNPDTQTVYDPFCGSGTILVEALDLGCNVLGSDLSKKAVNASQMNCTWFTKKQQLSNTFTVFEADATHIESKDVPKMVDAIVFEGYLGPQTPDYTKVHDIVKGLEKMYRGVFKHLYKYLAPNGIMVCALPEFHTRDHVKNLDHVIDWASELGYTRCDRFTYGRPQATVKRAIYVLQKTGK